MSAITLKNKHGFSLIELILVLSIVAVMASLSAPHFSTLINETRLMTQTNKLIQTLNSARNYAINNQTNVYVCQRQSNNSCSTQKNRYDNWKNGWLVYADRNGNNQFDNSELLQAVDSSPSVRIIINQSGRLRFFMDGSSRSIGFYLCIPKFDTFSHIYLLYTGRTRHNKRLNDNQKQTCLFSG